MPIRTNTEDVRDIIDTDVSDLQIENTYIPMANNVVEDDIVGEGSLSDDRLAIIEKNLAAHFIRVTRDRQLESFSQESTSGTFTGEFGDGFNSTTYGQVAVELDSTDSLKDTDSKDASFEVFG